MSILLKRMLFPYMAPAGDADGGGGTVDRGDDFVPTDDDTPPDAAERRETPPDAADESEAKDEDQDVDPEDPDADAEDKAKKKDSRIPLSRHKDILDKERAARTAEREAREAAEAKLAQYEKGQKVAAANEDIGKLEDSVTSMEEAYLKQLAEGEVAKAAETMKKIRQTERQIIEAKNDFKMQASIAQATEQARYNVALERVEEAYPQLNPDSDDFDKSMLGEVAEMKLFYEQMRNMTPTKALQAAVKKILGQDTRAQEKATDTTPKVDAEDVAKERKKAAVAKNLDASKKTPANASKVGLDSDKAGGSISAKDIMKMSQDDFRKLPDDVLARMRGDEFV